MLVSGSVGNTWSFGVRKSKTEVRSPATARCHGLIAGTVMPKRCSRKRPIEVWSNTCELIQPPRVHGEITYIGTRGPNPYGRRRMVSPLVVVPSSAVLPAVSKYSPVTSTVDLPCRTPLAS
ncbi:hypothetical protein D9M72_566500 [compost metagenome]